MAHEHRDHISSITLDAASWKQMQARSEEIERQLGEQLSSPEVRAARDSFGSGLKPKAALIVEGRDHGERPSIYDSVTHVLASTFRERIAGRLSQVPQEELNNKIQDAVASATASGVGERLLDRDVLVELQRLATK